MLRKHVSHVFGGHDTKARMKPALRQCRIFSGNAALKFKSGLDILVSSPIDKEALVSTVRSYVQYSKAEMVSQGVHDAAIFAEMEAASSIVGLAVGTIDLLKLKTLWVYHI